MINPKIIPHLWFDQEAEEAAQFYTSIFPDSNITQILTIRDTPSGDSDIVTFNLAGYSFMAINGAHILNSIQRFLFVSTSTLLAMNVRRKI